MNHGWKTGCEINIAFDSHKLHSASILILEHRSFMSESEYKKPSARNQFIFIPKIEHKFDFTPLKSDPYWLYDASQTHLLNICWFINGSEPNQGKSIVSPQNALNTFRKMFSVLLNNLASIQPYQIQILCGWKCPLCMVSCSNWLIFFR